MPMDGPGMDWRVIEEERGGGRLEAINCRREITIRVATMDDQKVGVDSVRMIRLVNGGYWGWVY